MDLDTRATAPGFYVESLEGNEWLTFKAGTRKRAKRAASRRLRHTTRAKLRRADYSDF
jgi:hypothetical protein